MRTEITLENNLFQHKYVHTGSHPFHEKGIDGYVSVLCITLKQNVHLNYTVLTVFTIFVVLRQISMYRHMCNQISNFLFIHIMKSENTTNF